MCARCDSSRRTSPFSAIICMVLSTVVYCVGRRAAITSCTSRTVVAPRLHSTVRISSSASVGFGSSAIYEDLTTETFVCQGRGSFLVNRLFQRVNDSRRIRDAHHRTERNPGSHPGEGGLLGPVQKTPVITRARP